MSKESLLAQLIDSERKEAQLMGELLLQRRKNKRLEMKLGREFGVTMPEVTKVATPERSSSSSADSLKITCVNCKQLTPGDVTRCINCNKDPRRKGGVR